MVNPLHSLPILQMAKILLSAAASAPENVNKKLQRSLVSQFPDNTGCLEISDTDGA